MKYQIMVKMLMLLLSRRKVSAREIADRYEISVRSVYRYIEELCVAGIPIDVARGRYGGIMIADTYRLPVGYFTKDEYTAAVNALTAMASQVGDEAILTALEKLQRQSKSENADRSVSGGIIVDGGTWGDTKNFADKMQVCERAVEESLSLDIDYISRTGEHSRRIIDPHVLIFKQNIWYVYAFCHTKQDFRTFKIGRIKNARYTGKTFEKRKVTREEIPLNFRYSTDEIKYCLDLADVEVLVFGPEFVERMDAIADDLPGVRMMFFIGPDKPAYTEDCCKLMNFCSSSAPPVALEEEDYAAIDRAIATVQDNALDGFSLTGIPKEDGGTTAAAAKAAVERIVAARKEGQIVSFEGNPAFIPQEDIQSIDLFVLATETVENGYDLRNTVLDATDWGVPKEKMLLAADFGGVYYDSDNAETPVLEAMADNVISFGPMAGLALYGIESDYYHYDGDWLTLRSLISRMNP